MSLSLPSRPYLFFTFIPALLFGTYTMFYFDVPKSLWMMNLGLGMIGITLQLIFFRFRPVFNKINPYPIILISMLLLMLTFLDDGFQEVHRWVSIGKFKLNIGLMVSPLILIQIYKMKNQIITILVSLLTVIIFLFQPDASLVTAFSGAATMLLLRKKIYNTTKGLILILAICVSILASYRLDSLPSVNYVEGIMSLTWQISSFLAMCSIISLALLPLPFFAFPGKENRTLAFSLGVYFSLILLATLFGNFPVMVMGYGISPIIGYFIGLVWLGECDSKPKKVKVGIMY